MINVIPGLKKFTELMKLQNIRSTKLSYKWNYSTFKKNNLLEKKFIFYSSKPMTVFLTIDNTTFFITDFSNTK